MADEESYAGNMQSGSVLGSSQTDAHTRYERAMTRQWAVQIAASNIACSGGSTAEHIVTDAATILAFVEEPNG